MAEVELRGITWQHPRGLDPLVACSAVFEERHGVKIEWQARSLQGFADATIRDLSERFDLVVFDHPHLGTAIEDEAFIPLSGSLGGATMADWRHNSVGPSFTSYEMDGELWGAPVDAAGTVAAWRSDLLEECEADIPMTWSDVLELSRVLRRCGVGVATPLLPIDSLTAFLSILVSAGAPLFESPREVAAAPDARSALGVLSELASVSHRESLSWSPIAVLEVMSTTDEVAYSPLLFGYSNYSRPGFRSRLVDFGSIPNESGRNPGGILGGAGIGISRWSRNPESALRFVEFVCGEQIQRDLYTRAGGQPGHRTAWVDPQCNQMTNNFFQKTLPAMDAQVVRPRHNGYLSMQTEGGEIIHDFLSSQGSVDDCLEALNQVYASSLAGD